MEDPENPGQVKFQNCAHGKFLTSSNDGNISTSTSEGSHHREWRLCREEEISDDEGTTFDTYSIFNLGIKRYLTCEENRDVCAIIKESVDEKEGHPPPGWNIELLTGELCFMSSPTTHRHLSCHALTSELSMSPNRKGWEVWRFVEAGGNDGHVRISNWIHGHGKKYLFSDENGNVSTSDNPVGSWEKWSVELAPEGFHGVAIKSVSHNRYLQVGSDGTPISTCEVFGALTLWHLDAAHSQNFAISSIPNDKRIGCGKEGQIYSTDNRKEWEVWEMQQQQHGFISLRSRAHGKILCSDTNGNLFVTEMVDDSGLWKLAHSEGGLHIISKSTGRYLSCGKNDNHLATVSPSTLLGNSESWSVEPILPDTITASQLRNNIIGGSLAVASILAAPFAVMGVIGAMGFGTTGIAGGSVAAGMMSAEAISAGGAIAAGGTVATLQSIGAVGLGVAGTAASMSAGAVVGASVWGIAATSARKGPSTKGESNIATESSLTRPFCHWQFW